MDRRCAKCKKRMDVRNFNWRNKAQGRRQSYCRKCQMEYTMENYRNNREVYYSRNRRHKEKRRIALLKYLIEHPCVDCGETDPVLLDFDHKNHKEKIGNVSEMHHKGVAWEEITTEIKKCEIRCVKCHRKKTAKENGWQEVVDGFLRGFHPDLPNLLRGGPRWPGRDTPPK